MLVGIVLGCLVLAALAIYLSKPKDKPISSVRLTETQIYCWHCMGTGPRAIKTQLTTDRRCQCGSRDYTLAGSLGPRIAADLYHKREVKWN